MNNDQESTNLIGLLSEEKPELIGILQEEPSSLIGYITPAVAYIVPVPEVPTYGGPFIFIPSDEVQTINVGGHIVSEDITIDEIPFAEVTNPYGGYTVTIGG